MRLADGALPAPLFARLAAAVRALGERGLRGTYQRRFWFPLGAAPACVVEEAIPLLSARLPSREGLAGAEWWLSRMRTTDVGVDFHQDHDVLLAGRTGRLLHPRWSTLLYLNRARGGLLAVTGQPPDEANPACAPLPLDADLARPAPNRFVWFDGRLTHGVLDANDEVPACRLPGKPPLRLAVAVNFWERPPLGIPRFAPGGAYAALATGRASRGAGAPPRAAPRRRSKRSRAAPR